MTFHPKQDGRYRTNYSVRLWVVIRKLNENGVLTHFGINESIERTVYRSESSGEELVRYLNHYHPLYPSEEFLRYRELAVAGEIYFFSNEAGLGAELGSEYLNIAAAPFIYDDEDLYPADGY